MSLKEREHYDRYGKTASDKFYVNEDARKNRENALRQNGRSIFNSGDQTELGANKFDFMRQAANERQKVAAQMETEAEKERNKLVDKKRQLKQIQMADKELKDKFRREKTDAINNSVDFGDRNVLSYCYAEKIHKAHEYRQKTDKYLNLIGHQFECRSPVDESDLGRIVKERDATN